jgi:hypothetical protein
VRGDSHAGFYESRGAQLPPATHLRLGLRQRCSFQPVFLPSSFQAQEVTGSWQLPRTALVLAAWTLVGLLVALRTFRCPAETLAASAARSLVKKRLASLREVPSGVRNLG